MWIVTGGGKKMGREILFWAIKDQVVYIRLIGLIKKEIVSKKVIFQSIENQLTITVLLKIVNNVNYISWYEKYIGMKYTRWEKNSWENKEENSIMTNYRKKIGNEISSTQLLMDW